MYHKKDKLDCPWCGKLYEEEFAEANIAKTIKCIECEYSFRIKLNKSTYISLNRRLDNTVKISRKQQLKKDKEYFDKITNRYIKELLGKQNQELFDAVFTKGRFEWVREVRSKVIFECYVMGLNITEIKSYFKSNGGRIRPETIKNYIS